MSREMAKTNEAKQQPQQREQAAMSSHTLADPHGYLPLLNSDLIKLLMLVDLLAGFRLEVLATPDLPVIPRSKL
jgi:hypothetical protein